APGLDPPRVVGVVHADDVQAESGLGGDVDVLAVGAHLAPLAVGTRNERDVARMGGVRHLDDREAGRDTGQREPPAARRRVCPGAGAGEGGRGGGRRSGGAGRLAAARLVERGQLEVREQRHVQGRGRGGGRGGGDGGRGRRALRAASGQGDDEGEG